MKLLLCGISGGVNSSDYECEVYETHKHVEDAAWPEPPSPIGPAKNNYESPPEEKPIDLFGKWLRCEDVPLSDGVGKVVGHKVFNIDTPDLMFQEYTVRVKRRGHEE